MNSDDKAASLLGKTLEYNRTGDAGKVIWAKYNPLLREMEVVVEFDNGIHFGGQLGEFTEKGGPPRSSNVLS